MPPEVEMRWSKSLWVGLSGTSLVLAVGCSQGAGAEAEPTDSETAAATATEPTEAQDKTRWDDKAYASPQDEASRIEQRETPAGTIAASGTDQASPWFLRPPGADPNAPVTPASDVRPENPKPFVSPPTQPVQVTPRPRNNWVRAACGRG